MFAGAHRRQMPAEWECGFVTASLEPQVAGLEERTVEALRDYIAALVAWKRAKHRATCPICGREAASARDRGLACEAARDHKEKCRRTFSDLCDELGYIPQGHGVGLPDEERLHPCSNWTS